MKKIFLIVLIIGLSQIVKSQDKNESYILYTKEFTKLSPLDFKHNRFKIKDHASFIEVKTPGRVKLSSPNYKNQFEKLGLDNKNSIAIVSRPTKLTGPNYKNRRFQ